MRKILIKYIFHGVTEENEFSYNVEHFSNYDSFLYNLNIPLMHNNDAYIESPSAHPYTIPIPIGIRKCHIDVKFSNDTSLIIISGKNLTIPVRVETSVPFGNGSVGIVNEESILGSTSVTDIILDSSGSVVNKVCTGTSVNRYSGELYFPVKYGKSPGTLFSVNGDGNSLYIELTKSNPLPTELFEIGLSQIEFGGVPSPDY